MVMSLTSAVLLQLEQFRQLSFSQGCPKYSRIYLRRQQSVRQ